MAARVAVVGAGRMGSIRAPIIAAHSELEVAVIVDDREEVASALAARCGGGVAVARTLEEALASGGIQAVFLATPSHTHPALISVCASDPAIRAVFVEKPVAETPEAVDACYEAAARGDTALVCGFQRRLDPSYARVAAAVHGGELGPLHSVRCTFRDHPMPPLPFLLEGGDPFTDLAPHDVDYIRHLMREEPCEVYAVASSFIPELREAGVLDSAHMMLRFASGAVATIEMARATTYGYDQRAEVFGELGMAEVHNPPKTAAVFTGAAGVVGDTALDSFPQRFAEAFALEVAHFADVLLRGARPMVTRYDAMQAQRIAIAALESHRSGKPVALAAGRDSGRPLALRFVGCGEFGAPLSRLIHERLREHCHVLAPYRASSDKIQWKRDVLSPAVDAAYICSPDEFHHSEAIDCLAAGKDVLVEKPVHELEAVLSAARDAGRVLWIGLQRRFDAEYQHAFARVKERVARGECSEVVFTSKDPVPPHADDKFVLFNSVVHDVDSALQAFPDDSAVEVVSATVGAANAFDIALRFSHSAANGGGLTDVRLVMQKNHDSYVQQVSVDGELFGHDLPWPPASGSPFAGGSATDRRPPPWFTLYVEAQVAQFSTFLEACRRNAAQALDQEVRFESYRRTFGLLRDIAERMYGAGD